MDATTLITSAHKPPTAAELGAAIGVSRQRAARLRDSGTVTGATLAEQILSYCQHLRDQAAGRGGDAGAELSRERALLARAQREKLEREARIAEGQLLDATTVVVGWQRLCYAVRSRLLSLPQALAPVVAAEGEVAKCHALLTDAVHDALTALSEAKA